MPPIDPLFIIAAFCAYLPAAWVIRDYFRTRKRNKQMRALRNASEIHNSRHQLLHMIVPLIQPKLKSPPFAVFCEAEELVVEYDWNHAYIISGHVYSPNRHGVMLQTKFTVKALYVNHSWQIQTAKTGEPFPLWFIIFWITAIAISIMMLGISIFI